jgi:hypothetical protein
VKGFDVSLFQSAYDELRARGVVLKQGPGEYHLNYPNGTAATEYITDDLQDALRYGREMATKTPQRRTAAVRPHRRQCSIAARPHVPAQPDDCRAAKELGREEDTFPLSGYSAFGL